MLHTLIAAAIALAILFSAAHHPSRGIGSPGAPAAADVTPAPGTISGGGPPGH